MQTFTFESKSGGKPHTARVHPDGRITCTCRGFSSPNKCWHVRDVAAKIGTQPVQATIDLQDVERQAHPVTDTKRIDPMLASALPEGKTIADYDAFNWVMELKVDGHRLILQVSQDDYRRVSVKAWSRAGNVRELPPHIIKAASQLATATYDAELDIPGGTSTDVTALDKQHLLRLTLFDLLKVGDVSAMNRPGTERRALLEYAASEMEPNTAVRVIEQFIPSKDTLDSIWAAGGEGVVIKRRAAVYQAGRRSKDWIKFKRQQAAEVTITGFEAGKLGPHSTIIGVDAHGIEVRCKTLNDAWRADFEKNAAAYIGRTLVISYQEKTRDGRYRHPMADHIL